MSVTRTLIAATSLLLAPLPAATVSAEEPKPDDSYTQELLVQIGRTDFLRYCASCHGVSATGDGPAAASLNKRPADLTRIADRRGGVFPAKDVASYIDGRSDVAAHGTREMPVWGRVFAARIHERTTEEEVVRGQLLVLVEYLRSIQHVE